MGKAQKHGGMLSRLYVKVVKVRRVQTELRHFFSLVQSLTMIRKRVVWNSCIILTNLSSYWSLRVFSRNDPGENHQS